MGMLTGTAVVVVPRILPGCSRAAAAVAGRSPAGGRPGTLLDSTTCSTVRKTLELAKMRAKGAKTTLGGDFWRGLEGKKCETPVEGRSRGLSG